MWRLSDGFPHGLLPRPLVGPRPLADRDPTDAKRRKKKPYVRRDVFLARRDAWDDATLDVDSDLAGEPATPVRRAHNVVDRRGRGTLETGGLYFVQEDWRFTRPENACVDVYVEAHEAPDKVGALFHELGEEGFGRDASTGRGRWTVEAAEPDADLVAQPGLPRRFSLSRGALTPQNMRAALWRLTPHFGKAGPQVTASGSSPFKKPALLMRPGATFEPLGDGPFGRWIVGVHPHRPEIGLNALHVAVPFAEAAA
jgi:CRISPR-associated protein Csm4